MTDPLRILIRFAFFFTFLERFETSSLLTLIVALHESASSGNVTALILLILVFLIYVPFPCYVNVLDSRPSSVNFPDFGICPVFYFFFFFFIVFKEKRKPRGSFFNTITALSV